MLHRLFYILPLLSTLTSAQRWGVREDSPPAETHENVQITHYSSAVTKIITTNPAQDLDFTNAQALTDGMLYQIALEAAAEKDDLAEAAGTIDSVPPALTVMQAGSEIYISSSIKFNAPGFITTFPSSPASLVLAQCCALGRSFGLDDRSSSNHRSEGNCGEPGAVHMWFKQHNTNDFARFPQNGRIVTVGWYNGEYSIWNPCGNNDDPTTGNARADWGCTRFIQEFGLTALPAGTQAQQVPDDWYIQTNQICL
ncbi:hypothetical protein EJ05DRAFT_472847 [Pseudovirgaria hyperparasitica]|uniref:Secreted protein n=1 Tax=Pseudovirgaria hyperparasitica TaxID=470096 RepID=A0A6A6WIH8_9PEZI|nr:uncharacterized protein EJ05DRAFT_472847 [Pseudovirgaria hyperparasitica]KAF2761890.1 hypothetical protein EJ05DRAFT_472847 [Pseudovirgaria hyperparasitica]